MPGPDPASRRHRHLLARRPGARRRRPFPRVTGLGPAGGDPGQRPMRSPAARFVPPGGNGPCVTGQFVTAATRVFAGGVPVLLQDSVGSLRADRHADAASCSPDRAWSGADAMQLDFPYHFDGRERTAETGDGRPRPRPDRAAPVHPARRAGEPPRVRRGRHAAGLRRRAPGGRRHRRVHDPRRAAAALAQRDRSSKPT